MGNHKRMWGHTQATLVLVICLLILAGPTLAQDPQVDEADSYEIIGRLNQWRMDEGVWPLQVNDTLMQLAYMQAAYLYEQDITGSTAWHTGREGENPRERSQFDPFNWPYYNNSLQIAIGENAGYGTVNSAINFWMNSQIHATTALNAGYREVGAAAIPQGAQTIYIVVFGSRPDVLTAQVSPFSGDLHFSGEQYRFAAGERIQMPTRLRLFDDAGRPLTGWEEWQASMAVPEDAQGTLTVLFSDGSRQSLAYVNLEQDEIVLPGYRPTSDTEDAQVVVCPTAEPMNCPAPVVDAADSDDGNDSSATDEQETTDSNQEQVSAFVTNTPLPQPTATRTPTRTPTPIPTATPTLTPTPEGPEIEIYYNNRTVSIVNVSSRRINLQGIEFVGGERTVPITQWTTFVNVPLQSFPSGSCLQSWSWNESTQLPQPRNCSDRWSVLTLSPNRLFWVQGFEVYRNGGLVAICSASAGECSIDLP